MAAAHALVRAIKAICEANRVLVRHGRSPAPVATSEMAFARHLAHAEVVTALREPGRQLVTLLHNRSAQLAANEAELEAVVSELTSSAGSKLWGAF